MWNNVVSLTGMATLKNSIRGRFKELVLSGNSTQLSTTGKNLFDFSNLESGRINNSSGALEENNHTRRLADYIDITDITSFSISLPGYKKANGAVYVITYYYDKDKNYLSCKYSGDVLDRYENIVPVENAVYIKVTLEQNTIDNPQNIFKVQLEKGSTATSYEPYTGGRPSPSPEYQQEIVNSGKLNADTQKYEVSVSMNNGGYLQRGSYMERIRPLKLEKGKTYRIYVDINSAVVNTGILNEERTFKNSSELYAYCNNEEYPINNTGVVSGKCKLQQLLYSGHTFTVTVDGLFLYQGVNSSHLDTDDAYVTYDFIKKVDISSPYNEKEPVVLTSDRPLTQWDKLVEQDGQYGWLYQSRIEEYYGDTLLSLYSSGFNFLLNNKKISKGEGYCSQLLQFTSKENTPCIHFNMAPNQHAYTLNTQGEYGSSVSEIKEYLKSHPLHLVYKTENTEFVPLSEEEQIKVRNLHSYNGTTNIIIDSGEVPCGINVTYKYKK